MSQMPILTSGRGLMDAGLVSPPYEDDGADWAELIVVDVSDEDASFLGSYWDAYDGALRNEGWRLAPFDGQQVAGYPLVTDLDLIEQFDTDHGVVDVREIYDQGS